MRLIFQRVQKMLSHYFRFAFTRKFHGTYFCILINIIFRVQGKNQRISYYRNSGLYAFKDFQSECYPPNKEFLVVSRQDIILSLWNGLDIKAKTIGEAYFLENIEWQDGDLIIDCGAQLGFLSLYLMKKVNDLDLSLEYQAFEPSEFENECIKNNTSDLRRREVHKVGLWNENRKLTFYVSSEMADSSLIKPPIFESTRDIQVKRLDSLFPGKEIKLLKVEAEGGEPEVLEGALNILPKIQYIAADLGPERGIEKKTTYVKSINFLLENGFELVELLTPKGRGTALFRRKEISVKQ